MSDSACDVCSTNSTAAGSPAGSCSRPSASPPRSGRPRPSPRASAAAKAGRRNAHDAGEAAVREDRLEYRAPRSLLLSGRRLRQGCGVLPGADELADPQRRWQAGGARHRRLGRPRHPRRLSRRTPPPPPPAHAGGAPAGGPGVVRRRRNVRPRHRGLRRLLLGHRAVGREDGGSRAQEARADTGGRQPRADFQSFHVKDPDGFDLQISNGNRKNRRQGPATGKTSAPAPFASTRWKTVWLDHISFEVSNYKETVAFYTALLGWTPGTGRRQPEPVPDRRHRRHHHPPRLRRAAVERRRPESRRRGAPAIGHISFGIAEFDPDQVKAELRSAG